MRHLLTTAVVLALLTIAGGAVAAQEASQDPEASPTPEQLAEAEERLATASCLGKPATIVAIEGFETLGTSGADVIVGTDGDDVIRGEGGNDRICAGPGADTVEGGDGQDRIDGGLGDDELDGGAGNDTMNGGKGADMVLGAAGNDRLSGAGGHDTLDGGRGNDVCKRGPGHDWLPGCNDKRATKGRLVVRRNTTLKGPHRGPIVIDANNVTLDCGGHTVKGPGAGFGIWLVDDWRSGPYGQGAPRKGATVKNCDVTGFTYGILLSDADRNTITRNRLHENARNGIQLFGSSKNTVSWNVATDNGFGGGPAFGFEVAEGSDRNRLMHNSASGSDINFYVENSSRNTLIKNTSAGGELGFSVNANRNTLRGNRADDPRFTGFGTAEAHAGSGNRNVLTKNTVTGSGEVGFHIGGFGNRVTGNGAHDNLQVGFGDASAPGANSYADNTCIGNREGASRPAGLCDDTVPAEPEPVTEPSGNADAEGEPTAEE